MEKRNYRLSRRTFIKYMGTLGGLAILAPACRMFPRHEGASFVPAELTTVSDDTLNLYRSEFSFTRGDSQGFSPHCVNCKGNCSWQTFEKGGRIVREEQTARYPQISPDIPDANPRGCNKGALHSQSLYEKDRILYPLKRDGSRGEGKWRRISWDEAMEEIASKIVDLAAAGRFGEIMIHAGSGVLTPVRRAASLRLASLLGAVRLNVAGSVGDMFPGATIAYGISTIGCSSEAWYEADYLLIGGMNPTVSRIPDAHYIWEGKYRGSRVVTVSPEYTPTARQSTLWILIKPGTDSFLAMSMVHVILEEGLYDGSFIREQTDLPFLVRLDNGRLLRQAHLFPGGSEEVFYFMNEEDGRLAEAPGSKGSDNHTLDLRGARPALTGGFVTLGGKKIEDERQLLEWIMSRMPLASGTSFPPVSG